MEKLEDLRDILINKQHMEKVSMAVINGILQAIALNMLFDIPIKIGAILVAIFVFLSYDG